MKKDDCLPNADQLLNDQYKNSRNLGDRAQLHRRYSSNSTGWFPWVFSQINLKSGYRVLECGAGPGWLWQYNLDRIPENCLITITDFSQGMVDEAKKALEPSGHDFKFLVADVQNLEFEDCTFDIVLANHMLYHVPKLDQAIGELRRVLKTNGFFLATTVGEGHMSEIRHLVSDLNPDLEHNNDLHQSKFTLENGQEVLNPWFSEVELLFYENQLQVTDPQPIIDYIFSTSKAESLFDSTKLKRLTQKIRAVILEKGYFLVSTKSGLFRAKP